MAESIITLGIGASSELTWFVTSGLYVGEEESEPISALDGAIFAPFRDKRVKAEFRDKRVIADYREKRVV